MSRWRIWRAGPADRDALARLEAAAFGARSWGAQSVAESFNAARIAVLFVGETVDAPAGFAMWRDLGQEAELLTIGVVPAARRQGAGAALLGAVLGEARNAGALRIHLEVDAGADAALGLYRAAGFERSAVRRRYYRDGADAIVMQATL